ncbi:MAG: protease inhibitor I42 family protein [Candidatus Omnitrophica bacterium]|nr:protease inhibitor I42 family protein [Candidatus Omnitrophota bacterium]
MKTLLFLVSVMTVLCGCIQKELAISIPVINENEMKKEIVINTGDLIKFALESNPTTGYHWHVKYDSEILRLTENQFIEGGKTGLAGSSGTQKFVFRAVKTGETIIQFSYIREWEKNTPPAKKIVCQVKIN